MPSTPSTPRSRGTLSLIVAAFVATHPAHAQTDSTRADSTTQRALPQILVTAQRRAEIAQSIGVALTPLSGRDLSARAVVHPNDIQRVVPGLEIEPAFGGGQPQYRLRGVGFSDYATNNSATVGVSVDQVALPFPVQTQGLLFDLARIEVLRGPQGTLYGRNSTAGAVNFLSNRPTAPRQAGLNLEAGSFGAVTVDGFISGRLARAWRARLSAATQQGGSWQRHRTTGEALGARDHSAVRGQLEWDATPRVNLLLVLNGARDASEGQGLSLFTPLATGGGAGATVPADTDRRATGWGLRAPFANSIGVATGAKPGRNNRSGSVSLQGRAGLGALQLTSITAWNRFDRDERGDWDATPFAESDEAFQSRIGVFSQEVRIAPSSIGPVEWVAGVYASRETLDERFYSDFTNVPGIGAAALTRYGQQAAAAAAFAQLGWAFRPSWKAIAGARGEYEARELQGLTTGFIAPVLEFVPPTDRRLITRQPSGKLALEYTVRPDVLTYVSLSRGSKSGGFTAYNTTNVAQLTAFRPEVVYASEVGLKAEPTRFLRINASVYHYEYRDQQVLSTVFDQVSRGPIGRIANAARSTIDGGELELFWQVTPAFELQQFATLRAGRFQEFMSVDAQASLAAKREVSRSFAGTALNIPRTSLGGSATYRRKTARLEWTGIANYSVRDVQEASRVIFTPEYDVPGYTLVNATLTMHPMASRWSVQLWGRNIGNTRYDITRNFFINANVAAVGQPATAGIRISTEYGVLRDK